MEEGKNEIMELRQMIEGCFERQNKLIARLEMELEALSNFNGKQMLDSRDMRLQLKVCDRTLIRWRMSGKLPSFKISGKVYQNENALPLGYTTAHVITRAEYEKLSSLEKQQTQISDQQEAFDTRMEKVYQRYLKQFTQLSSYMSQMDQTSSLF